MLENGLNSNEIDSLMALDQDQLYTLLVPPEAASDLHHPGALVARGKSAFVDLLRSTRGAICEIYNANKDTVSNSIELVSIIASAMMGAAGLEKEAVLPAAVLVVKIGLTAICKGLDVPHGPAVS